MTEEPKNKEQDPISCQPLGAANAFYSHAGPHFNQGNENLLFTIHFEEDDFADASANFIPGLTHVLALALLADVSELERAIFVKFDVGLE